MGQEQDGGNKRQPKVEWSRGRWRRRWSCSGLGSWLDAGPPCHIRIPKQEPTRVRGVERRDSTGGGGADQIEDACTGVWTMLAMMIAMSGGRRARRGVEGLEGEEGYV